MVAILVPDFKPIITGCYTMQSTVWRFACVISDELVATLSTMISEKEHQNWKEYEDKITSTFCHKGSIHRRFIHCRWSCYFCAGYSSGSNDKNVIILKYVIIIINNNNNKYVIIIINKIQSFKKCIYIHTISVKFHKFL